MVKNRNYLQRETFREGRTERCGDRRKPFVFGCLKYQFRFRFFEAEKDFRDRRRYEKCPARRVVGVKNEKPFRLNAR